MLLLGLASGIIAILVGSWRQMCTVLEASAPFELPSAWRSTNVRILTWTVSTVLSIFFAFAVTGWIIANELPLGPFWFGVILVLRWFASNILAATVFMKNINIDQSNYELNNRKYKTRDVTPPPLPPPVKEAARSSASISNRGVGNILVFLVVPIAVLIGIVWLGSQSGSGSSPSDTAIETSSPVVDECYSLVEAQNYDEAIAPCRQAAEQGDAGAQVNLGWMYDNGTGVPEDDAEAVKWYRLAADQGDVTAQYNLALMYDNGTGVPEDDAEAVKWYRLAADQGDADAQRRLKELATLVSGVAGRLPSETSYSTAQSTVDYSSTSPRDKCSSLFEADKYSQAAAPCRQAAEQGDTYAQNNLGWMYDTGSGVPEDHAMAIKWYNSAAEQGDAVAQYNLGKIYDSGSGVPKDISKAVKWYRLAAKQGDADAKARLAELGVE